MAASTDLTGQRFGRLLVQRRSGTAKNGAALWTCSCDCGKSAEIQAASLRAGRTQSCGCLLAEFRAQEHRTARTHGHTHRGNLSPTWQTWRAMHKRCSDPKNVAWKNYGGRGVKVCVQWSSFEAFLADMGERPPGTTLDRFPNKDGNYEPANCRWATWTQQANNRRPPQKRKKAYEPAVTL